MNKFTFLIILVATILLFTSCSSNGSSSSANSQTPDPGEDVTAPTFTMNGTVSVEENQTIAIELIATDSSTITYSISGGDSSEFDVNSTSGVVTFKTEPNYNIKKTYSFVATATDSSNNSVSIDVIINILNSNILNSTKPIFTSNNTATVIENQTTAITLVATDDSSAVTYSISGIDSSFFDLNTTTGVVIFKSAPNFETKQNYNFTATATDSSSNSTTQEVSIIILDENIQHNGISYESVISPKTGRTWLDRNLGASQVCTAPGDVSCYGDYYQWGRETDGHENLNSSTSSSIALSLDNTESSFIISSVEYNYDWIKDIDNDGAIRASNWAKTDGTSICPAEYRVPTITELENETVDIITDVTNIARAFNIFLKLPYSGYRNYSDGINTSQIFYGSIWSNSTSLSKSYYQYFFASINTGLSDRTYGRYVRCIKDSN